MSEQHLESLTTRFNKYVFEPYRELLKAEYRFHDIFSHARSLWEEKLSFEELVHGPYLEKSQMYAEGDNLSTLGLHEKTISTINHRLKGRGLYKHQTDAISLLLQGDNAIIATGTSSGKTLCYQIPILDNLIRDNKPGLRAIIIYPLNALVNDQLNEWEEMLREHKDVTFARFTGQTPTDQKAYEYRLKESIKKKLMDKGISQQKIEQESSWELQQYLSNEPQNRLNHRDAIRNNPPHVLVTNFSMLEYLLVRPVDSPIFQNSNLQFLVLDEAHSYRGIQSTEIAFLVRRLKERLGIQKLTCIATSATLGKQGDAESTIKVRKFASMLFGESFSEDNPIYGTSAEPPCLEPTSQPEPEQYLEAALLMVSNQKADIASLLGYPVGEAKRANMFDHDMNLYRLRKEILVKPILLQDAAHQLWPDNALASDGLQALIRIIALAKTDNAHEDMLPTRLHYFVRSQDGLHICLHKGCPGRKGGKPAIFVSRKNGDDVFEGDCPECAKIGQTSKLVELVTCRKCGYLYGALQDMGPRRAQNPDATGEASQPPCFDSFNTELGWAADSFWSYFSVEDELPSPEHSMDEEEDGELENFPDTHLNWCVVCGKKKDNGAGDNCTCDEPHLRDIQIFHRQCPNTKHANLHSQQKTLLKLCPNCGSRNGSGLEPVRRFQESDDETGLAMAIPLAHFDVSPLYHDSTKTEVENLQQYKQHESAIKKLLCFTDHRQRAAAFPSLLEEETFAHDMGRKIVEFVGTDKTLDIASLGEMLYETAEDQESRFYDSDFFLPVSRYPDEEIDQKAKKSLWIAEVFGYFSIPDAARESAEDLGLVTVEFELERNEIHKIHELFAPFGLSENEAINAIQTLLRFMRQRKAFTLPPGVEQASPAFGIVTADISFMKNRDGNKNVYGWLPKINNDGSFRDNTISDYLRRLLICSDTEVLRVAEDLWQILTSYPQILIGKNGKWKLDHERLKVVKSPQRYVCKRCGIVTSFTARGCCPKKSCSGKLELQSFELSKPSFVAQWVAGAASPRFTTLKSEEHTAQINKDLAKKIEDDFRLSNGINLLSSTTTFEMGINIGDLQKVLLRNAPPTSASYVQRVGRAGRGRDKNSVCVTLCRRTKYDADIWSEPARVMTGVVRTPTVFLQNTIISQRHFNATLFSAFLKQKFIDEKIIQGLQQQLPVGIFLPIEHRNGIPDMWFKFPKDKHANFSSWLSEQTEDRYFKGFAGKSLIESVGGYENGSEKSVSVFNRAITDDISESLDSLMKERKRVFEQGGNSRDIDFSIKNLINADVIATLAKKGFLPRYAFPLDVVALETAITKWSNDAEVELSRDRAIAISEFAPGAQVVAHKKVFSSAGLYILSTKDKPDRLWYSKCKGCEQIRTAETQEKLKGPCPVCGQNIAGNHMKPFVEPNAFSVNTNASDKAVRFRRSTLIRQRQGLTHFIDSVPNELFKEEGLFHIALKEKGKLFRYNLGPEGKGFFLCPDCGLSLPESGSKNTGTHKKLRSFSGSQNCSSHFWPKSIAYGHQFESYCLIIRPQNQPPSVPSLAYALQKAVCDLIDLDAFDIGVSWRWLGNNSDGPARSEIVLYDNTPGGAGFVSECESNWQDVVLKARELSENCNCDSACYNCIKNYYNQTYHEQLDIKGVVAFLSD